jgi:hypothetical protein
MCFGPEAMAMMALTAASSAMNMMMQKQQAAAAAAQARRQAEAEAVAAKARAEAEYAEANRQVGEAQQKELEDKSDLIREANEELGAMRAAETSLTEGSLGNLFFENDYAHSVDLIRVADRTDKMIDAARASKAASSQGYTNTVTMAQNNAQNAILRANAQSQAAVMGFVSSGIQIGVGQYKHDQTINAIKGT